MNPNVGYRVERMHAAMKTLKIVSLALWSLIAVLLVGLFCWLTATRGSLGWSLSNFSLSGSMQEVLSRSMPASDISSLDVSLNSADIVYSADTGDTIRVTCYSNSSKDKSLFSVSQTGKTLSILENGYGWGFHLFDSFSRRVEVVLPASWHGNLSLKSLSGDIRLPDSMDLASLSVSTASGDIACEGGSGSLKGSSVRLKSVSGDVRVTDISSPAFNLSSISGDITANDLTGAGELSSTSGNISATLVSMDGAVSATSVSGDIRLGLASGVGARLDAHSVSGSITASQPLTTTGSGFGRNSAVGTMGTAPYQPLNLSTTSGDIHVG